MGIDHQSDQNLVVSCGGEPAQRIEKAHPVHVDVLALGCLPHDEAHQIVNQRKNYQRFEHPVDGLAFEDGESHSGFQMRIIRFNAPPGTVELCQGFNTVEDGINQRRNQGDGFDPKAFALDPVASLADLQAVRELCKRRGVHPVWTVKGFEPLYALIARPKPCHPA